MNAILAFALRLILVLLIYLFVGLIGFSIFKDLKRKGFGQKEVQVPTLSLVPKAGQEGQFSVPEVIIGRDPTCQFILDEETVSLRHCRLFFDHKQWWAEDLDSTNGTFLNGERIETRVILTNNDELRLGQETLTIRLKN
jgi:hypothetical protein